MSIIDLKNGKSKMQSFIMSCRALGREIEKYFFNFIRHDLKKKKYKKIIVSYKKNDKNKLVKEFFDLFLLQKVVQIGFIRLHN